jgi:AcrR family transcriptional regulator
LSRSRPGTLARHDDGIARVRRMTARTTASKPGLRQRKKDETRARLLTVSRRLFTKQGYEATTLEQIADGAGISVPTLLVYFESKERLALAPEYDTLSALQELLGDAERSGGTLELWRDFVEVRAKSVGDDPKAYLARIRFYNSHPALARAMLSITEQQEAALAAALAVDFGTDAATDLPTQLLATVLAYGMNTVVRNWARDGGPSDLAARALAVVDFALHSFPKPGSALAR